MTGPDKVIDEYFMRKGRRWRKKNEAFYLLLRIVGVLILIKVVLTLWPLFGSRCG